LRQQPFRSEVATINKNATRILHVRIMTLFLSVSRAFCYREYMLWNRLVKEEAVDNRILTAERSVSGGGADCGVAAIEEVEVVEGVEAGNDCRSNACRRTL
jgi:hypothetical protein